VRDIAVVSDANSMLGVDVCRQPLPVYLQNCVLKRTTEGVNERYNRNSAPFGPAGAFDGKIVQTAI
jgi:hypothetical protein